MTAAEVLLVAGALAALSWWGWRPRDRREFTAAIAPVALTLGSLFAEEDARAWVVLAGATVGTVVIYASSTAALRRWRQESYPWWRRRLDAALWTVLAAVDSMPYATASEADLRLVLGKIAELGQLDVPDAALQGQRDRTWNCSVGERPCARRAAAWSRSRPSEDDSSR